ncbi:MAG: metallophosphoesterase family protein [Anaerolineae bacterium]
MATTHMDPFTDPENHDPEGPLPAEERCPQGTVKRPTRFLLLADIHANREALQAVLQDARGCYDAIWFLGDVVGYGPRPVECVQFLKVCVRRRWKAGNHEVFAAGLLRPGSPVRPTENMRFTDGKHKEILEQTAPRLWAWLKKGLMEERIKPIYRRCRDVDLVLAHANLLDHTESYLYPDDTLNLLENLEHARKMTGGQESRSCWVAIGHSHMVFLAQRTSNGVELLPVRYREKISLRNGAYVINPGSVGQPRDGDPRASYAILDVKGQTVEFRRVDYPVQKVQRELQRQGYPQDLVETLSTGRRNGVTEHFERVYQATEEGLQPR